MRILTWNVNSVGGCVSDIETRLAPQADVICLQEIKRRAPLYLEGFVTFWNPCEYRSSYAGTAILARQELCPEFVLQNGTKTFANEGRTLAVRVTPTNGDPSLVVLCVYTPNSGVDKKEPLRRLGERVGQWDPELNALAMSLGPRVVVCGDLNVAVRDIDVHNPKANRRKAGFTMEERESFQNTLLKHFKDAWVVTQGVETPGFTFFGRYPGLKENNKGWRLDYCLVAPAIPVLSTRIWRDVDSSDHVPLEVVIDAP